MSNAVFRGKVVSDDGKIQKEVRIFKRPDGNFTVGEYKDEKAKDTAHIDELRKVDAKEIKTLAFEIKIITGKNLDV